MEQKIVYCNVYIPTGSQRVKMYNWNCVPKYHHSPYTSFKHIYTFLKAKCLIMSTVGTVCMSLTAEATIEENIIVTETEHFDIEM